MRNKKMSNRKIGNNKVNNRRVNSAKADNRKIAILCMAGMLAVSVCACDTSVFTGDENKETTKTAVVDDTTPEETEDGTENVFFGNTFYTGGSEIQLREDGSFMFYKLQEEYDGDYYAGTYEAYCGQEAVDKIAGMEKYGLTEEELENYIRNISRRGYRLGEISGAYSISDMLAGMEEDYSAPEVQTYDVSKDVFYCLILHNAELYMDGETQEMTNDTVYIGYYIDELQLVDTINIVTVTSAIWELQ